MYNIKDTDPTHLIGGELVEKAGQVNVGIMFCSPSTTTVNVPEAVQLFCAAHRPEHRGSLGELPDVFNSKIKVADDRMITADLLFWISHN